MKTICSRGLRTCQPRVYFLNFAPELAFDENVSVTVLAYVLPPSWMAISIDMPRCRGVAAGSVLTRSAKQEPWMPLEIQVLVPLTR